MKTISQRHLGIQFRSRAEARWAEYFDRREIKFEYEPEGYQLGSDWYVPDFLLPLSGVFFEVKPTTPNEREVRVAKALARDTKRIVVIACGNPSRSTQIIGFDDRGRQSNLYLVGDFYRTAWLTASAVNQDAWSVPLGPDANGKTSGPDFVLDQVEKFQFHDSKRSRSVVSSDWRDRERLRLGMPERRVIYRNQDRSIVLDSLLKRALDGSN